MDQNTYRPSKNPYYQKILQWHHQPLIILTDHQTEDYKGRWRETFTNIHHQPICVEIGCNAGHVFTAWAAQQPEKLFIGIENKYKAAYRAAEKILKKNCQNAKILRANANRIEHIFGKNEVQSFCIFFPDPWIKKHQRKNRLLQGSFFEKMHHCLEPQGNCIIRTDHLEYFESTLQIIEQQNLFHIKSITFNLHQDHNHALNLKIPDITLFEGLFIQERIPIKQVILEKLS